MIYYGLHAISEGRIGDGIGNGKKKSKTLSDEELVKAAQSGNNEALEAILSRYKNLVYAKSNLIFLPVPMMTILFRRTYRTAKPLWILTATDFRSLKSLQEYA